MKKLILGIAVMVMGFMGALGIVMATVLSPLHPYSYNGISGWVGCLLGMDLVAPFVVALVIAAIGFLIAIWGMFEKNN